MEWPAQPCGPDWPVAVFVKLHDPDGPYATFAAGKLGVPQPEYRVRHLVVLYNYLSGRPLTPAEQRDAVDADAQFNSSWRDEQKNFAVLHPGYEAWVSIRTNFGAVDKYIPPNLGKTENYNAGMYFDNCLDDAFLNAAHTLAARETSYGSSSADVTEWVRAQDVVFQACGTHQAPLQPVSSSASAWLRQDRAYQLSAANLYTGHKDEAVAGFRDIAADSHSSWGPLARYLVMRLLVNQAFDNYSPPAVDEKTGKPVSGDVTPEQYRAAYLRKLREYRAELLAMQSDPHLAPYRHATGALLDRVNARLDPAAQRRIVAARLTASDSNFEQDVIDLSLLRSSDWFPQDAPADATPAGKPKRLPPVNGGAEGERADDLLQFLDAMKTRDRPGSLLHWHALQTKPWLIASLALSKPGDSGVPELLEAAKTIPASSPAWTAATYHRLRLSPDGALRVREMLLAAQPRLREIGPTRSTTNLFLALQAQTAPGFHAWLKSAARLPADQVIEDEEWFEHGPSTMPCSGPVPDAEIALFDTDAATILNTRVPLRLLVEAAQSPTLPAYLRFTVAQSAWTRAVLLNRPADARRLTPLLEHCSALWRPVLETYDHAVDGPDREAAALFALMRFPSTEPRVREGNLRDPGFPLYSEFRDNWWTFPLEQEGGARWMYAEKHSVPKIPTPAFLRAKDQNEAAVEYAALDKLPDAPTYFFRKTIAWQRAHPHDPRTPDLLGEAFRVARNGYEASSQDKKDKSSRVNYEQQLFLLLHRNYPNSPWTKRYRVWDANGD
ncbi:MAG TPA: hypothetical protein VGN16_23750 [Acidobacteriaceae bacterium]|jgi:hypothetical protein